MEPISVGTLIAIVGTVVSVVLALAEALKHVLIWVFARKDEEPQEYSHSNIMHKIKEVHTMSSRVFEIVSKTDENGTPLAYFPKSHVELTHEMIRLQRELADRMKDITWSQQRLAEILDGIAKRANAT